LDCSVKILGDPKMCLNFLTDFVFTQDLYIYVNLFFNEYFLNILKYELFKSKDKIISSK
jgi:hypothetical protein